MRYHEEARRCLFLRLPSVAASSLPGCIFLILLPALGVDSAWFQVVGPGVPVAAMVGGEIMLPCHLSPPMSAASMEVLWYRTQHSPFVHLYLNGTGNAHGQMPEYRGRTELSKAGMANGSVALRLRGIRASDEGQYTCFVRSSSFYADATLELTVAGVGSSPFISVEDHHLGGIRVVCRTAGWYPEPEMLWKDPRGQLLSPLSETKSKGDSGLFEIQTSIIVKRNTHQNLTCCVQSQRLNQEKEATIHIADSFFPRVSPEVVCLYLLLSILFFSVLALCVLKRKDAFEKPAPVIKPRNSALVLIYFSGKLVLEIGWRKALAQAAKVTLDAETAHPELVVHQDRKSVRLGSERQNLPDVPQRFDTFRCVLGREGFTAGRHYWEVEVGPGGRWWAVGVVKESVARKGWHKWTSATGIWAVQHRGSFLQAYTNPVTRLAVNGNPRKIRISLDYEGGQVAFFNAEKNTPIFSFPMASFHGEKLFPFFWVGDTGSELTLFP
ncbi:butyrophilin subfamily 1 member A1-like isoform X2 [Pelodiscus sinensis]|uniref:butyrophilin subfamily 1 member A1-like isoform X2 n=1 Tax=Pelodiscus sinensis TaxID=13735 RepID=UPI003F6B011E